MSMSYIRQTYGVPAKRGGRVEYKNSNGRIMPGVITSARGPYLRIRLDGDNYSLPYHPTWNIKYL